MVYVCQGASVYRRAEAGRHCLPMCMERAYGEYININSIGSTGNLDRMVRREISGQRRVYASIQSSNDVVQAKI